MKLPSFVLLSGILLEGTHAAGPVIGTACWTACLASCSFGLCGWCVGTCVTSFACYDDNTSIKTKHGTKAIREVEQGEEVLTLKDGKEHWSKVTLNLNIPVDVSGTHIKAVDLASRKEYEMTITDNHNVPSITGTISSDNFIRGVSGDERFDVTAEKFDVTAEIIPASDIKIGNHVQVMSGSKNQVSLAKVTSTKSMEMDSKNVFFTADGTVLANDILTAASCDVPTKKGLSLKEHMVKSADNSAYFECVKDAVLETNLSATFAAASVIGLDNGDVYATDIFMYLLKHCGGIVDIIPELIDTLGEAVSPTSLDIAALLQMKLEQKVVLLDANGDDVVDSYENPSLPTGSNITAIDMNPFLCSACHDPIDLSKFDTGVHTSAV